MPTVPRYERSVQAQPLPSPRLSADVPLAAFGVDTSAVSHAAQQIYIEEKRKADQIAILDADNQLAQQENAAIVDMQTKRGKDAFDLPNTVMLSFDKKASDIADTLNNDTQQIAFRRATYARRYDLDRQVQHHVARERSQYDNETIQAYVSNEHDAAIINFDSPDRIRLSIERQRAALTDYGNRNGMPQDFIDQKLALATSKTHAGVVERMLANGSDLMAKQYYDKYKSEITDEKDILTLEKALNISSVRGEAQRQTDAIVSQPDITQEKALEKVRGIKDPAVRDSVEERVNRFFTERKMIDDDKQRKLLLSATDIVDKTMDVSSIPPTTWAQFNIEQRNALEARAKRLLTGEDPVQNDKKWLEFLDLTPTQLSKMDQNQFELAYHQYFDKQHWDRAAIQWGIARDAAKDPKSPALSGMQNDKDIVFNAFGRTIAKPDRRDWSTDEKSAFLNFEDAASAAVQRYELTNLAGRRKATDEEKQKIVNDLMLQKVMVEHSFWFNKEKPLIMLTDDERKSAYVPVIKIPQDAKLRMINLAKSWRVIPSNTDVTSATNMLAPRLERAYGASLVGRNDETIKNILMGK